ncbi:hypothetical protein SS50377_24698 [Spironucleus salmonicida]|uniref:Uncharacterized protein n=1 Tax=Spironucleus salmonicida TaxID=348837 RepID=V6LUU6_9EUKA|nr:hypothetical protein SS50377_24698 [Spironucleus salmonicida]|eukprot:EST44579.1 Hypothetical protein SS50377_15582 [Spironucleus salmonicida]
MSNILKILKALSSDNAMLLDDTTTDLIVNQIQPNGTTTRGIELLQNTLNLLTNTVKDEQSDPDTSFGDDLTFNALKTSIHSSQIQMTNHPLRNINYDKVCVEDPIKEQRYRDPKIQTATVEHIQRQQLARAKNTVKHSKNINYSIKSKNAVEKALQQIPDIEASLRTTRSYGIK